MISTNLGHYNTNCYIIREVNGEKIRILICSFLIVINLR